VGTLTVALISDVFFDADGPARLARRLEEARKRGAALAVLPELPLNAWIGVSKRPRDADAEPPGGPRFRALADAARAAGLGLVGGAIVTDPSSLSHLSHPRRYNTALVFDRDGHLIASYRKMHLPHEDGFWETSHYAPGDRPPAVVSAFAVPIGVQICSDVNRPEGCHLLAALGAEAIVAPRATEAGTFERWKLVLRANAVTSCAYVLSVGRPAPEQGVPLGGPSIAIDPNGEVLVETTEPIAIVTLDRAVVAAARKRYPGYLPTFASVYAEGWRAAAERGRG
jgi:N-carbamoylputrescine amidase